MAGLVALIASHERMFSEVGVGGLERLQAAQLRILPGFVSGAALHRCGSRTLLRLVRKQGREVARVLKKWAGPGCVLAGVIWILIWWHQQLAHGATQDNEMNLVAGMSWMDTGKLVVVLLILVFGGLVSLIGRREGPGRLGRVGARLTLIGLGLLILATVVEFWTFPWGSYEVGFEDAAGLAGSNAGGAFQAGASLLFTLGLTVLSIDLVRAGVVRWWAGAVLVMGGLTTVFLSPVFWFPAVAWCALGIIPVADQTPPPRDVAHSCRVRAYSTSPCSSPSIRTGQ